MGLRELVPPPDAGTLARGSFSLSHDGRLLAYTTASASGHVSSHILDLESGENRDLGGFNQGWPTYSPDGERLALIGYPGTGAAAQAFIVSSGGDGAAPWREPPLACQIHRCACHRAIRDRPSLFDAWEADRLGRRGTVSMLIDSLPLPARRHRRNVSPINGYDAVS